MSALNARASTVSSSWMSIARLVFPARLELKSLLGSFNEAPLANVSLTTDVYVSPVQMIPSCSHVGVPGFVDFTHFTSSTTSGSASLMSLRILLKVSPRQSPSSAILLSIRSDADWPSLESDSFMFSSRNFQSSYGMWLGLREVRPSRGSDSRARGQRPPPSSRSRRWTTGRRSSDERPRHAPVPPRRWPAGRPWSAAPSDPEHPRHTLLG